MEEKERLEFDIEDIIKEFSDHPEQMLEEEEISVAELPDELAAQIVEQPAEQILEEVDHVAQAPIEQLLAETEAEEAPVEEEIVPEAPVSKVTDATIRFEGIPDTAVPVTDATIRFEGIPDTDVPVTDATVRFDRIPDTNVQVRGAQRILDEEEDPIFVPPVQEEKTEPYSEEWEPEYEQPIAEYVPPKPIIFHPKSRLRELKKKLVAGPERLYYLMSEKGLGKLQAAIFFSLIVVILSAAATVFDMIGWVPAQRIKLMVFGQFFALLLSALLGCYQLMEGFGDILRKRFTLNSLLLFTFIICCVDGILCLQRPRVPCCAAFGLQVTMSLWNRYHKRSTRLGQLDTMRKATCLDRLTVTEDYCDGVKGILRSEGQVEEFMDALDKPSRQEKTTSVYALIVLGVSVALGVAAGVLKGLGSDIYTAVSAGIQVASVTILAGMPASLFVAQSRPMAILERRHHALGTVLCGWQGVEALSGKMMFPVDHEDLLPVGSAQMNGVKFYGSRNPDEIIAYTTAVIEANGGSMLPLFTGLLDSRNGKHYVATNLEVYENGGIGGTVNGEQVLVGTLSFLQEMGVQIPEGIRVSYAVCAAVEGEMCGLYAISFSKDRSAAAGLGTLCSYRGLKPVLTCNDFVLTEQFVRSHFAVKTKRMVFPESAARMELQNKKPDDEAKAAALVTGEGLAAFAYAATGARTLKSAVKAGLIVHLIGGILGLSMMVALVILGRIDLLTPVSMLLYELIWMVPGLLITEWTRSI